MKIAFLVNEESSHSPKWTRYFQKNHEIYILKLKRTKSKALEVLINIFSIRKQIKEIKPDILHVHYAGVNGLLGALSNFHPLVITAWGSDILINSKRIVVKPLLKFILDKADLITCDAEHMVKAITNLGIDRKRIRIIYFGVDTLKFSPGPKNEELMQKLKTMDDKIIISLRNLKPIYDIETIIKSAPIVLKEIPEAKFIIGASGPQEEYLKKLAKDLNVAKNVKFIGRIQDTELPSYLRIADVYVSTSLSDAGISSATAEAMACGLPVIVTDTGENKNWIKEGENGFIIPIKAPQALAEKIVYLLRNKDIIRKFGELSRRIIEERNNYYVEMAKMEAIYNSFYEKNKKIIKGN